MLTHLRRATAHTFTHILETAHTAAAVDSQEHTRAQRERALPTPQPDAIVGRAGHDFRAVGREAHRIHVAAVGARPFVKRRQCRRVCTTRTHTVSHCTLRTRLPPGALETTESEQTKLTPQLYALVSRARHDPRAIGREAHGIHIAAAGAQPLSHQRQCRICAAQQHTHTLAADSHTVAARRSTREDGARECRPPQSLMLESEEPDTIFVPSGEKTTDHTSALWAHVCSATSASVDPSAPRKRAHTHSATSCSTLRHQEDTREQREQHRAPHSSSMPRLEPDTILVPSGEKLTECTEWLWALACSASIASVDASAPPNRTRHGIHARVRVCVMGEMQWNAEREGLLRSIMPPAAVPQAILVLSGENAHE
eukprot:3743734-Prymnesium_polylepis.2